MRKIIAGIVTGLVLTAGAVSASEAADPSRLQQAGEFTGQAYHDSGEQRPENVAPGGNGQKTAP